MDNTHTFTSSTFTESVQVKRMEVLEGECLCDSLGWLEGRRSKNNWLLLLPSSCGFMSFSANDWQLLYDGQTLKDKLTRVCESIRVCVCVDALDVYVWTEACAHTVTHWDWNQPYKCDTKLEYIWGWFNVPVSTVCVEWLLLHARCHPGLWLSVSVCVWCWVPPSSFLHGKTLLSLFALPVMTPLSPLICTTRLAETKRDGLVDTSLSARTRGDWDMKVAILQSIIHW